MLSTITTKGQVTIPKPLRDLFSINPHDKIDFSVEDDRIILRPIRTLRHFRGCIQSGGEPDAERSTAKKIVGQRVMEARKWGRSRIISLGNRPDPLF